MLACLVTSYFNLYLRAYALSQETSVVYAESWSGIYTLYRVYILLFGSEEDIFIGL